MNQCEFFFLSLSRKSDGEFTVSVFFFVQGYKLLITSLSFRLLSCDSTTGERLQPEDGVFNTSVPVCL